MSTAVRGSLTRQLQLRVAGLTAAITVLAIAVTVGVSSDSARRQLDARLDEVMARSLEADPHGRGGPGQQLDLPGQPLGTIAILTTDGTPDGVILDKSGVHALPDAVSDALSAVSLDQKHSLSLGELGRYRVVGRPVNILTVQGVSAGRAYWGLPLDELDRSTSTLLLMGIGIGGVCVFLAWWTVGYAVRRTLVSLSRVAAVATEISGMSLSSGDVSIATRVGDADADQDNEAGQVGSAINSMLDNVESALAARQESETTLRQFVADASHELRTPLASIAGYSELLRRFRDDLPEPVSFATSRIDLEAQRMTHLVQDLLFLARLDSSPQERTRVAVDLVPIVSGVVAGMRSAYPEHSWSLEVPESAVTLGDGDLLRRAVRNILLNAAVHTPPGTKVVTRLTSDGQLRLTVSDDGPGIPAELGPRVLERFTRADSGRARNAGADSTGLGLAIVATIVRNHGGTVEVGSPARGSEFRINLPKPVAGCSQRPKT
ncbi:hypothetical protein BW730_06880 [Tessaracoccus aquimaris]|uniref:histidine kinase n=1 Tax=Tessaracoccus aquimaris TaxID=1332264 RepID=A0A1Q2CME0_9ACTN|nr:ATP-binding protein [Tessaracoccus aquimaris]AQP47266.1 hypothetical protein BW730_06880 [Tessaracoccus aquimaris]